MPLLLDATGLQTRTQQEVLADLAAAAKAALLPSEPDTVAGNFLQLASEGLASVEDVLAALYAGIGPTGSGVMLDNVLLLAGLERKPATRSAVTARVTSNGAAFNLPIGTVFASSVTGARFIAQATVAVAAGGQANVPCLARDTGPVALAIGELTVIVTPVAGLLAVTNLAAAEPGENLETDQAFRVRHLLSLAAPGVATIDAIRGALLGVPGVLAAKVYENTALVADVDGVPGKAIWCVVDGGADAAIAAAIWVRKPAGILAHGSVPVIVADSQGVTHTVYFDRPTPVSVFFKVVCTPAATVDEIAAIKAALVASVNGPPAVSANDPAAGLQMGDDVTQFRALARVAAVVPAKDTVVLTLGFAPNPAGVATLAIGKAERATTLAASVAVS